MSHAVQYVFAAVVMMGVVSCLGQSNATEMNKKVANANPLLCDPEKGACETPGSNTDNKTVKAVQPVDKKIKVLYFTDPICSSCWGIEPQLKKLKLEYGAYLDFEYRMGGLLPDWSYNSGGISKPSDVAHHWDEVSGHYDMPIDGDVWLEDPLDSSYPPSIAFKAAQLQDQAKALLFLREMREMVFLKKKNIAKWEHMAAAGEHVGLNVEQLKSDFEGQGNTRFEEDLKLARDYGVRGFPTLIFLDENGNRERVYGSRPYAFYEMAILKLNPKASKGEYRKDWETLFSKYHSFTAREFAELSGMPRQESEQFLNELAQKGALEKYTTKNGSIWSKK